MKDLDRHPLDLLALRADGDLEPRKAVRVDAHVAGCEGCARELARWQVLYRGLARLPRPQASPSLRYRILEAVARESARARVAAEARRRRLVAALSWAYGAGIALVAGLGLGLAFVPAVRQTAGSGLALVLAGGLRAGLLVVDGLALATAALSSTASFLVDQLSWLGALGRALETASTAAGGALGWIVVMLSSLLFVALFVRFLHQREPEQEVTHVGPMLA